MAAAAFPTAYAAAPGAERERLAIGWLLVGSRGDHGLGHLAELGGDKPRADVAAHALGAVGVFGGGVLGGLGAVGDVAFGDDASILNGELGGGNGDLGVASHDLGGFAVAFGDVGLGVEVRDLAGKPRGEAGGIKAGDGAEGGAALHERAPERGVAGAERGDAAETGDDDSGGHRGMV